MENGVSQAGAEGREIHQAPLMIGFIAVD